MHKFKHYKEPNFLILYNLHLCWQYRTTHFKLLQLSTKLLKQILCSKYHKTWQLPTDDANWLYMIIKQVEFSMTPVPGYVFSFSMPTKVNMHQGVYSQFVKDNYIFVYSICKKKNLRAVGRYCAKSKEKQNVPKAPITVTEVNLRWPIINRKFISRHMKTYCKPKQKARFPNTRVSNQKKLE